MIFFTINQQNPKRIKKKHLTVFFSHLQFSSKVPPYISKKVSNEKILNFYYLLLLWVLQCSNCRITTKRRFFQDHHCFLQKYFVILFVSSKKNKNEKKFNNPYFYIHSFYISSAKCYAKYG